MTSINGPFRFGSSSGKSNIVALCHQSGRTNLDITQRTRAPDDPRFPSPIRRRTCSQHDLLPHVPPIPYEKPLPRCRRNKSRHGPRNERLVHKRMVGIACGIVDHPTNNTAISQRDDEDRDIEEVDEGDEAGRGGSQYFLITPKLLHNLTYERGCGCYVSPVESTCLLSALASTSRVVWI